MGSGILGQEERLLRGEMDHFHHKGMDYHILDLWQRGCLGIKSENLQVWWGVGWAFEKKESAGDSQGPCVPASPSKDRWNPLEQPHESIGLFSAS